MSAPVPRVARVHIMDADNPAVRVGLYRSIADADAMLAEAFTKVPAPAGKPFSLVVYVVIWSDGYRLDDLVYLHRQFVEDARADGGILRHTLLRSARNRANFQTFGQTSEAAEAVKAQGRDLLQRLEVDAQGLAWPRNVAVARWRSPTLLPHPGDAIRRLQERFAQRRASVQVASSSGNPGAYPATNHADVRYLTNFVSLALGNDLASFAPATATAIWNHWRQTVQAVERSLGAGADTAPYPDNERLWRHQLPSLIRLLEEAGARTRVPRNGRLAFRRVGERGEAYPDWVQDLRGKSGVYIIRERQADGSAPIVYVGSSSADRLHETLTRHFQTWRRWKGFWRGQYGEGHDPGLTYDRGAAEAAVVITPAQHALELESRFIRRLQPRDNLLGQAEESIPF